MIANGKILELIIDGTPKGKIHLNSNGRLKITRLTIDKEILEKIKIKNMLNPSMDYGVFGYMLYIQILRKGLEKSFPDYSVELVEVKIDPKYERLYNKFLDKKEKFI